MKKLIFTSVQVEVMGGITQQDLDDAVHPTVAINDGQNFVICDMSTNIANNFQTTAQLNVSFYSKREVDGAIAVVDGKTRANFNAILPCRALAECKLPVFDCWGSC